MRRTYHLPSLFLMIVMMLSVSAVKADSELYVISGSVRNEDGQPIAGVKILAGGCAFVGSSVPYRYTDEQGKYSFDVYYCSSGCLPACGSTPTYRLTPILEGYRFDPERIPEIGIDLPLSQNVVQDFEGKAVENIAGTVTDETLRPIKEATISLSGCGKNVSVKTDDHGDYYFSNLAVCSEYSLTPAKTGYAFNPGKATVAVTAANLTGSGKPVRQDFDGTKLQFKISGSLGVADVELTMDGEGKCMVSGVDFLCSQIPYGSTVLLTPTLENYVFAPLSKTFFEVVSDQSFSFTPAYQAPPSCSDGKDNDNDGYVDYPVDPGCGSEDDNDESIDYRTRGCTAINIRMDKSNAKLGPGELQKLAVKALNTLRRNAERTNRALGARLKVSATKASRAMDFLVEEAQIALQDLPDTILSCPDTAACYSVDNTSLIDQHMEAVRRLRAAVLRTLNRATRLTSRSVEAARKLTSATGRKVRAIEKSLILNASKLPKVMSVCEG